MLSEDGDYRLFHGKVRSLTVWTSKAGQVFLEGGLELVEDDFIKTLKFVKDVE